MWKRNSVEYCSSSKIRPRRLRLGEEMNLTFSAKCLRLLLRSPLLWGGVGTGQLCLILCDS